jgi:hypothetical protein
MSEHVPGHATTQHVQWAAFSGKVLINAVTTEVNWDELTRWDEKAGLPRDAIRSQ